MSRDYAVNLKNFFIPRTRRRSSSFFRKNLRTQCIQSQRVATAPVFFADKNKGGAARRPLCLIGRLLFYGVSWVNDCFCPGRAVLTFYGKYVLSRPIGHRITVSREKWYVFCFFQVWPQFLFPKHKKGDAPVAHADLFDAIFFGENARASASSSPLAPSAQTASEEGFMRRQCGAA